MMTHPRPDWLTTDQACAYLGCSRKALYHHIARGHITAGKLGRSLRFQAASLDACLGLQVRQSPQHGLRRVS